MVSQHAAAIADRRQIDEPDARRGSSHIALSATRIASRVLPPPPIPVSVSSRVSSSSRTQSAISRSRPMNWVRGRGRLCAVPAGAGGAAAVPTSVIAAAIASANCAVLANRSSGRFASPRATIRASAGGTAGRDSVTGRASAVTCIRSSASAVAATNGGCPASISKSTQASE